jgi:membrane protein required for colicin V production
VALEGYDLVMLGILAGAALLGYFKGMVWQLAWIAGIVASSYVSFRFGGMLAPFFGTQAPWNRFAAMLAVYVGTSLAVWLVFRVISGPSTRCISLRSITSSACSWASRKVCFSASW